MVENNNCGMERDAHVGLVDSGVQPLITPSVSAPSTPSPTPHDIKGSALRQVVASFVANIGTVNTGMAFGFSAVVLPQLQAADSVIPVDEDQASWIASMSSITTPIGCILSGYLMDSIGRKLSLILSQIPLIVGWLLIAFADSVPVIYGGRLLVGLGSGMVGAPARVYTGEVTQPHLRGMLLALSSCGVSSGVLIEYSLGALVTWPVLAGISAAVPMAALLSILFYPETPNYLVAQNRPEDAQRALRRFRGSTCNVEAEVSKMVNFSLKNNCQKLHGFRETLHALSSPTALKPFGILVVYFILYQFSGVNTVTFYAVEIFHDSGTKMNKYLATVILGVVRLLSTIAACIALRKCGRRPLTMISGVGCGATMLGLGTYMYFSSQWKAAGEELVYTWFPVACLFIFTIACSLGFLVVPWIMIGELYPTQVRGVLGGLTTCAAHISVFAVVKTYPYLYNLINKYGAFWFYGAVCSFGCIFFYTCVPETKGKTLQEIEDYFAGRSDSLTAKRRQPAISILQVDKGKLLP